MCGGVSKLAKSLLSMGWGMDNAYMKGVISQLLDNGKPYKLGKLARQDQLLVQDPPIMLNLRDHTCHVCCPIGGGTKMWNFIIIIDDLEIDLFKGLGVKLLGLSGQCWVDGFQANVHGEDIMFLFEDNCRNVNFVTKFRNGHVHSRRDSRKASSFCQCMVKVNVDLQRLSLGAPQIWKGRLLMCQQHLREMCLRRTNSSR